MQEVEATEVCETAKEAGEKGRRRETGGASLDGREEKMRGGDVRTQDDEGCQIEEEEVVDEGEVGTR